MEAKVLQEDRLSIVVRKHDLMEAWKSLEKLVVSVADIGRFHGVPVGRDQTLAERNAMLRDLDGLLTPALVRELSQARHLLSQYLPADELEQVSDNEIQYWTPGQSKPQE